MNLLEIRNVSKSFNGRNVLDDVSFSVEKGEVAVILGPSGCGKSTLLRCINALEPLDSGEVILSGEVISEKKDMHIVRQKLGMVFQNYELFPHLSVLENILLGPLKAQRRERKEAEVEAKEWLNRVGLAEKAASFPRELSGGQKQRVAIVRALCMNPEIMLFDEVTAALDVEMVREVLDVIMNLAESGKTMLMVTHQLEFARAVADKIIFMDDGKIIEETPPAEFFASPKSERAKKFLANFTFEARHK